MTTITVDRELLEQALDALTYQGSTISIRWQRQVAAVVALRAALAASATAPEQCWCDEQNIGEPGVSCGDCPTRDYKHPATAPAWHDAPTCAGLWLNNFNFTAKRFDYWHFQSGGHWGTGVKWYGPIPEDKP